MTRSERQTVVDLQRDSTDKKHEYDGKLRSFLELEKVSTSDGRVVAELSKLHTTATEYFNAVENAVGQTHLLGAHNNEPWATGFAESCFAALETILLHHRAVKQMCEKHQTEYAPYRPSSFAFANMQRLVHQYFPEKTIKLKKQFVTAGLPDGGFDQTFIRLKHWSDGASSTMASTVVGSLFLAAIVVVAIRTPAPTVFQQFVFRTVLGLGGGAIAAIIPGFLEFSIKQIGWALRAGGGLGVFAVVYVVNPTPFDQPANPTQPVSALCRTGDLAIVVERDGDLIPGRRGGSGGNYASGRIYTFTVTNVSSACTAIVKDIRLDVLAAVPDRHPAMEATTAQNDYEVLISPSDVGHSQPLIPFKDARRTDFSFHFKPKDDPERFAVEVVPREWGTSYAFRFRVSWYDPSTAVSQVTDSPLLFGFFPAGKAELFGDEATEFRRTQIALWRRDFGGDSNGTLDDRFVINTPRVAPRTPDDRPDDGINSKKVRHPPKGALGKGDAPPLTQDSDARLLIPSHSVTKELWASRRMERNGQKPGCACGQDVFDFPDQARGKAGQPITFRYDASYICRGQSIQGYPGSLTGHVLWDGNGGRTSDLLPDLSGRALVVFRDSGTHSVRFDLTATCMDLVGNFGCTTGSNTCLATGQIDVIVDP
jgi:hypothetical protein